MLLPTAALVPTAAREVELVVERVERPLVRLMKGPLGDCHDRSLRPSWRGFVVQPAPAGDEMERTFGWFRSLPPTESSTS